jgi:hypothetical protein
MDNIAARPFACGRCDNVARQRHDCGVSGIPTGSPQALAARLGSARPITDFVNMWPFRPLLSGKIVG